MCRSLLANYISWAAEDLDFLSCGNDLSNCQRSAFPAAYKPISCQHPMNPAHLIALIFIPFFHLSWKMSFCWCTPFVYGMYCQSSVSFCPYRISFGSVVRPQCYDFINQIKYILCRRERTSIVPNTSHIHRHMPDDMMRCATDVYTDVTATTNRFQCRRTRSIWNVIINNFDTQIHFTISIFNFSFPRLYNFEIVQF